MKWIEVGANTVENAIHEALKQMGANREDVRIEVIEEGSRGFLGIIGGKQARVRVEMKQQPGQLIEHVIDQIIQAMDLDISFTVQEGDECWNVDFEGNDVRILIGRRGETLNSLQLIANLIINKQMDERIHLVLDAENYRKRREETLRRLARRLSERVKHSRSDIALEPMTPQERRIIHMELQENPWVYTTSRGEEPYRKVIISLKK